MCITINSLKEFFAAHDTAEVLGAPMGEDGLTRWEILRDQCAPPLPDTVYISDSLEAVKRLTPRATGHLVFCAGAAFDKTRLCPADPHGSAGADRPGHPGTVLCGQ